MRTERYQRGVYLPLGHANNQCGDQLPMYTPTYWQFPALFCQYVAGANLYGWRLLLWIRDTRLPYFGAPRQYGALAVFRTPPRSHYFWWQRAG